MFLTKKHINKELFTSLDDLTMSDHNLHLFKQSHNIHDLCQLFIPFKFNIPIIVTETLAYLGNEHIPQGDHQYINDQSLIALSNDHMPDFVDGNNDTIRIIDEDFAMSHLLHKNYNTTAKYIILVNKNPEHYLQSLILYCYLHYNKVPYKDKLVLLPLEFYNNLYNSSGRSTTYSITFLSIYVCKELAHKHTSLFGINYDPIYEYMHFQKWCSSSFMFGKIEIKETAPIKQQVTTSQKHMSSTQQYNMARKKQRYLKN